MSSQGSDLSSSTPSSSSKSWSNIITEVWKNPKPFADVTFVVGENEEEIQGHKLLLGLKSSVFKRNFYESLEASSQIVLKDITAKTFKQLLTFMYTGECDTETDTVNKDEDIPALAVAAMKYNVKHLFHVCKQEVLKKGAVTWYQKSLKEKKQQMADDLWSCILSIGEDVLVSEDFINISNSNLCKMLESDDLNCNSELTVCKAAKRWAINQCKKLNKVRTTSSLRFELKKALSLVLERFPLLTAEEFNGFEKEEGPGLLTSEEIKDMCIFHAIGIPPIWASNKRGFLVSQDSDEPMSSLVSETKQFLITTKTECKKVRDVTQEISSTTSSCIMSAVKQESDSCGVQSTVSSKSSQELKSEDFSKKRGFLVSQDSEESVSETTKPFLITPGEIESLEARKVSSNDVIKASTTSSLCIVSAVKEASDSCGFISSMILNPLQKLEREDFEEEDINASPNIIFSQDIFQNESSSAETEKIDSEPNSPIIKNKPISSPENVNDSQNSDELIKFTPKCRKTPKAPSKRAASMVENISTPIIKKPRSKLTTPSLKIKLPSKGPKSTTPVSFLPKSKPSNKLTNRNADKENSFSIKKTELKIVKEGSSLQMLGHGGLLLYTEVLSKCSRYSKVEKIYLLNVDIKECHCKRQEQFGKVLLNELKTFRLEINMGRLRPEELQEAFAKVNIEEFLFFIHFQDVNEQFIKSLQKYNVDLSINGSIILNVSPNLKSITTAFIKGVQDIIGNVKGNVRSLAFGYCDFSPKINSFPGEQLTELVVCKTQFLKDSCHNEFLLKCGKLETFIWFNVNNKGLNLEHDLSCQKKLKKIAICGAKLRITSLTSSETALEFSKVKTLIIFGGNWDVIENRFKQLFPKIKVASFGDPYSRPSCSLLKELLTLPYILTIEMWYFDIDTDNSNPLGSQLTAKNVHKKEIANFLQLAGIGASTKHFTLTKNMGNWIGKKHRDSEFEKRRYDLFQMDKFFNDFQSFTHFEE